MKFSLLSPAVTMLKMCCSAGEIEAPETNTIFSSGFVKDGAGNDQTSEGERNAALFFSWGTFDHFPRNFADVSFLF